MWDGGGKGVAYGVSAWCEKCEMWCGGRLAGYQFIDILGITSSSTLSPLEKWRYSKYTVLF